VVVTRPNSPRAGNWQELAREVERYTPEVYVIEDIGKALGKVMALALPQEMVCVTGSLYMVAEARELLLA
jgi:dihydrofolate synthase/folylpolyglutamate synthase